MFSAFLEITARTLLTIFKLSIILFYLLRLIVQVFILSGTSNIRKALIHVYGYNSIFLHIFHSHSIDTSEIKLDLLAITIYLRYWNGLFLCTQMLSCLFGRKISPQKPCHPSKSTSVTD